MTLSILDIARIPFWYAIAMIPSDMILLIWASDMIRLLWASDLILGFDIHLLWYDSAHYAMFCWIWYDMIWYDMMWFVLFLCPSFYLVMEVPWPCHWSTNGMSLSVEVWLIHGVPILSDILCALWILWYVWLLCGGGVWMHPRLCGYYVGWMWVCALHFFTFGRSLLHLVLRGLPSLYMSDL